MTNQTITKYTNTRSETKMNLQLDTYFAINDSLTNIQADIYKLLIQDCYTGCCPIRERFPVDLISDEYFTENQEKFDDLIGVNDGTGIYEELDKITSKHHDSSVNTKFLINIGLNKISKHLTTIENDLSEYTKDVIETHGTYQCSGNVNRKVFNEIIEIEFYEQLKFTAKLFTWYDNPVWTGLKTPLVFCIDKRN